MRFHNLPVDIIVIIFEYLLEIYLWHCNLTRATLIAAELHPEISQRILYTNKDYRVYISKKKHLNKLIALHNKYPFLLFHIFAKEIAADFGCQCELNRSYFKLNNFASSIIFMIFQNKSFTDILKIFENFESYQKYYALDLYIHLADETQLSNEMKNTVLYQYRLMCRNGISWNYEMNHLIEI